MDESDFVEPDNTNADDPSESNKRKRVAAVESDDEHQEGNKLQKKAVGSSSNACITERDLPANFKARIEEMNGTDIILVIQKNLFKTDIVARRLSIPVNQTQKDFLTKEEKMAVDGNGMEVVLIEPCLKESKILLTRRRMSENYYAYLLSRQWRSVVNNENNSLKHETLIQIWSFRVESKLRLALVRLEERGAGAGEGSGSGAGAGAGAGAG